VVASQSKNLKVSGEKRLKILVTKNTGNYIFSTFYRDQEFKANKILA
jgi:hypothetical protein